MPFDIQSARKNNYSDSEIEEYLNKYIDVPKAKAANYSLDEIAAHVASKQNNISAVDSSSKQQEALKSTPETKPDVPLTSEQKEVGGAYASMFPRTFEAQVKDKGPVSEGVGAALDVYSLIGRSLASSPAFLGALVGSGGKIDQALKQYTEELGKTTSSEGGVTGFAENVLRDPATAVTLPIGGPAISGAGKVLGTVGKAVAPTAAKMAVGAAGKAATNIAGKVATTLGKKAVKGIAEGAVEGVASGVTHQGENIAAGDDASGKALAAEALTSTLLPAGMSGAKKIVSDIGQQFGKKSINAMLKPGITGTKDGFKINNVFKYGLQDNLDGMDKKINEKFTELRTQLNDKIAEGDAQGSTVDIPALYHRTMRRLSATNKENFGDISSIENGLKELLNEVKKAAPEGDVSLADAQLIKRATGKKGAWFQGSQQGKRVDPDASAKEKVYNTFYNELKKEIERVAPDGVKEINKQFEEIIPIDRVVARRQAVAQGNLPIGILDVIAASGGIAGGLANEKDSKWKSIGYGLAAGAGSKMLRSAKTAKVAYATGKAIERQKGNAAKKAINVTVRANAFGRANKEEQEN